MKRTVAGLAAVFALAIPLAAQVEVGVGTVSGDSLVSIGDEAYLNEFTANGPITYLKYPTLGCPALVSPGGTGRAIVKLPAAALTPVFSLTISSTGDAVPQTYALPVTNVAWDPAHAVYNVTYSVPAGVARDTYDLQIVSTTAAISDQQVNCLRVVEPTETYTFLVVSDSHFHDPRGYWGGWAAGPNDYSPATIVPQIQEEIRAVNPAFVVVTGDLMFGWDYDVEYPGVRDLWKGLGVPVFMVPGNHDGQACVKKRTFLGIVSPKRDGLRFWRRFFGPTNYSFEFGGVHFQGVNSMDGTTARRDGFRIVVENYGGDLLPAQMAWISSDLAGTTLPVVPFLHHPAFGVYRANKPFGMTAWVIGRIVEYLTTGNLDDFTNQGWNTQATGQWLMAQYEGKASVYLCGHDHKDTLAVYGSVPYVQVTASGSDCATPWGYRPVRVEDGEVASYLYTTAYPSVPAGNLHVEALTANDGTSTEEHFQATSGLPTAQDVRIEVTIATDAAGYDVTGGAVAAQADLPGGVTRLWIDAPVPAAPALEAPVTVSVDVVGATPPPDEEAPATAAVPYPSCNPTPTSASAPAGTPVGAGHALIFLLGTLALLRAKGR